MGIFSYFVNLDSGKLEKKRRKSYWHRNRYEDQWNGIENPDTNPHSHLIFDKGVQSRHRRKDSFLTKCAGKTGYTLIED
jgi:hypothetical protein